MSKLFDPITLRDVTVRNRLMVSPMCMYSSVDGFADDWHLVHLGSRAVGGAGLVFTEAIAVEDRGRISPVDLGIYRDEHIEMLARIAAFITKHGAVPGTQLAHAGRKASTVAPWMRSGADGIPESEGGWIPVAPSPLVFGQGYIPPRALRTDELPQIVDAFAQGARRSLEAGFKIVELQACHGYLLHEFLSPVTNQRTDAYGGSYENRTRLLFEVLDAIRKVWPERYPLMMRLSVTDYCEGGWGEDESIALAKQLPAHGVDILDCSSGALTPTAPRPSAPLHQVPFARRIRAETGMKTAAIGMITTVEEAEQILAEGSADVVAMARQHLRDPYFGLHASQQVQGGLAWPKQYARVG
jgi:2,4-dienoyl-CoA reductase-like NADH-dependent reductase (Old Yellow Enzyme family)